MSLLDAPLALLDRVRRRREPLLRVDDPVARMVARTTGRLRPKAGYRRRLRGHVMNQYVAAREGLAPAASRRREMGRIGRSVLFASFALAVSVTAVGAASQSSLPGDALYPVKRQIEEIRMEIAPAWARPTLVAMALDERLSEVERLADRGDWSRAAAAAAEVDVAEAALVAVGGTIPAQQQQALVHHSEVLAAILAAAPDAAKPGLSNALAASDKAAAATARGGTGAHGTAGAPGQAGKDTASATPKPTKSPQPTPTPRESSKPSNAPPGQPTSPRASASLGS